MNYGQPSWSFVYFVQRRSDLLIKIGFSKRLAHRLAVIRCKVRSEIDVLGLMSGGRQLESKVHRRFDPLRKEGEWFLPDPRLLGFIAEKAALTEPLSSILAGPRMICLDARLYRALDAIAALQGKSPEEKLDRILRAALKREKGVAACQPILDLLSGREPSPAAR